MANFIFWFSSTRFEFTALKGILIFCCIYFHSILALAVPVEKTVIILGTFNYPPLMIDDGLTTNERSISGMSSRHGIGVDFIKNAFKYNEAYQLKIQFFPPKRAMVQFIYRDTDIFLGSRMDVPEIKDEIIPINIISLKSVLFCMPWNCDSANLKESPTNLGHISSIHGSPVNDPLEKNGNQVVVLQSIESTFKHMLIGRSDYVAAIDFAGYHTLRANDFKDSEKVKQTKHVLLEIPYDAVVRKDNVHSQAIVDILKAELKRVNFQLESNKLVSKYYQENIP